MATAAQTFRIYREWAALSQSEVARRAGIDPSMVSKVEAGKRRPTQAVLEGLIRALDIPPAEATQLRTNYARRWPREVARLRKQLTALEAENARLRAALRRWLREAQQPARAG